MYKKYDIKELNLTFFKVHCFPEEVSGTKNATNTSEDSD